MDFTEEQKRELDDLAGKIAEWLKKNSHPHMTVTVSQDRVDVREDVLGHWL